MTMILFLQTTNGIYSAFFTTNGREFKRVSNKVNNTMFLESSMFPNEQYKFNGRHFRLGINYVSFSFHLCNSNTFVNMDYI